MPSDDQTRWRFFLNVYGSFGGRSTAYIAIAPGCPTAYHGRDTECNCVWFETAFGARLHVRDANIALDAENSSPKVS